MAAKNVSAIETRAELAELVKRKAEIAVRYFIKQNPGFYAFKTF